jgi:hypothetical protein
MRDLAKGFASAATVKALFIYTLFLSATSYSDDGYTIPGTDSTIQSVEVISEMQISDLKIAHIRYLEFTKKRCSSPDQVFDFLVLAGPINPDATYVVEKLLKQINNAPNRCRQSTGTQYLTLVYMQSGGGYLNDGFALARTLKRNGAVTVIASTGECFSSCATAYLGGVGRLMEENARLGFHAPYRYTPSGTIVCDKTNKELEGFLVEMLGKEELGAFFYKRLMSHCGKSEIWSLNRDAADFFGLLTELGTYIDY